MLYYAEVDRIMGGLNAEEKKAVIEATAKVRDYLNRNWEDLSHGHAN